MDSKEFFSNISESIAEALKLLDTNIDFTNLIVKNKELFTKLFNKKASFKKFLSDLEQLADYESQSDRYYLDLGSLYYTIKFLAYKHS